MAKSPRVVPIASAPGLRRNWSTMLAEMSTPWTSMPRLLRGLQPGLFRSRTPKLDLRLPARQGNSVAASKSAWSYISGAPRW